MTTHNRRGFLARLLGGAAAFFGFKAVKAAKPADGSWEVHAYDGDGNLMPPTPARDTLTISASGGDIGPWSAMVAGDSIYRWEDGPGWVRINDATISSMPEAP